MNPKRLYSILDPEAEIRTDAEAAAWLYSQAAALALHGEARAWRRKAGLLPTCAELDRVERWESESAKWGEVFAPWMNLT